MPSRDPRPIRSRRPGRERAQPSTDNADAQLARALARPGTPSWLRLPKAAKGTTLALYVRATRGTFVKFIGNADKRGVLTITRCKRGTFA